MIAFFRRLRCVFRGHHFVTVRVERNGFRPVPLRICNKCGTPRSA